jgi:hypothetical protein
MAELKTKPTTVRATTFISTLENASMRADCKKLLSLFREVTGKMPKMWGTKIIGFGSYHYESTRSAQKGDWPLTGFAPGTKAISIYVMSGFSGMEPLLARLGKHTHGVSCLYVRSLDDIDLKVLRDIIARSVAEMRKRHHVK